MAILALQYASEHATTGAKLVELLTIRTSRFRPRRFVPCRGPLPGAARPKLKKVVDKFDAPVKAISSFSRRWARIVPGEGECAVFSFIFLAGCSGRQPQKPKSALRRSRLEEATC